MILLIDNYDSFTYNLYQVIAQHTDVIVKRNDQVSIEEIQHLDPDAIILSPGPGRPENAGICVDIIQQLSAKYPILGICLGHQALAAAFGGKVMCHSDIVHGKKTNVEHQGQSIFNNMPQPFEAARYHSLIVERESLPDCLSIIAENNEGLIMAIKHNRYPSYGLQFHPESILTPYGETLLINFIQQHGKVAPSMLKCCIEKLLSHNPLTSEECELAMREALESDNAPSIAAFITLLSSKQVTSKEMLGIVRIMIEKMVPVSAKSPVLDIVGTGGDGANTINISTGSAILAASAGVKVLKHGNRSVSSQCGSADVLEELGITIEQSPQQVAEMVEKTNIGFCFAPHYHPAFKTLKDIRKQLGFATIFNVMGPLVNPARAEYRMIGVYQENLMQEVADVLIALNVKRALVFHSQGLDEITTAGPAKIIEINGTQKQSYILDPTSFGFTQCSIDDLRGGDAILNASLLKKVYGGEPSAIADTLILNAAVAAYIYGIANSIEDGIVLVQRCIDSGAARAQLDAFQRYSSNTTQSV